jgi:hypothetical protein
MTEQEVYRKLEKQSPTGYRINELILFSYPVRRIRLDILANKQPDSSLTKVYSVILQAVQFGMHSQSDLFSFLGFSPNDEFMERELYALREKGYLDLVTNKWRVTEAGEAFIKDNSVFRVEEEEIFDFLIDAISEEVLSAKDNSTLREKQNKNLKHDLNLPQKSPELLKDKFQDIADIYSNDNDEKAYLINFSADAIKKDYNEWCNYWLIEYIPERNADGEPKLELRCTDDSLKVNKSLTAKFNAEYRHYIYQLSNIEREAIDEIEDIIASESIDTHNSDFENLTIWQTKEAFKNALANVKDKILIESPWIKYATQEYIPDFEKILSTGKKLIILYGIGDQNDDHHTQTLEKIKDLEKKYPNFTLIHLPTHFKKTGSKLTGTHRKLVIKDNELYISGSFNFLSLGKREGQKVANEESYLFRKGVDAKWETVQREYDISVLLSKKQK